MNAADRRNFLRRFTALAGVAAATPFCQRPGKSLLKSFERLQDQSPENTVTDETFWYQIKQAYTVSPNIINLNNGGVSPQPKVVQEAVERYNRLSNETPSYYMWRTLDEGREPLRRNLAALAGCSPEELAINRNSSEALRNHHLRPPAERRRRGRAHQTGLPQYDQRVETARKTRRVVLKWISFDFPMDDKAAIVKGFTDAFTPKTKVVHVTHMINWNGQILPAKEIAQEAHKRGIEVLVDGAHTFAHFQYTLPELECDYYGTSLHKWLCAPFGSGLLYVKKTKSKTSTRYLPLATRKATISGSLKTWAPGPLPSNKGSG
ncbi:MAG: aminotransferase class V-fold PLP-dependent enzyme [Haliscomenobacter sp.]|nr:aminotransferase class V-fold PLP-dependent enzyme [Haliscomenobacter sp.]